MIDFSFDSHDEHSVTLLSISQLTGKVTKMRLPIPMGVFRDCREAYDEGALVQEAFPMLNAEQREFLLTGSTQEEWDVAFPEEEEDEDENPINRARIQTGG